MRSQSRDRQVGGGGIDLLWAAKRTRICLRKSTIPHIHTQSLLLIPRSMNGQESDRCRCAIHEWRREYYEWKRADRQNRMKWFHGWRQRCWKKAHFRWLSTQLCATSIVIHNSPFMHYFCVPFHSCVHIPVFQRTVEFRLFHSTHHCLCSIVGLVLSHWMILRIMDRRCLSQAIIK